MHPEQQIFCLEVKKKFAPEYIPFRNARVLDCGSRDINGNNRFLFSNDCEYIGIDICRGDNVDIQASIFDYYRQWAQTDAAQFDTIICTEVLEHDPQWVDSLKAMLAMLRADGLLIITCATGDRAPHSMHHEGAPDADEYYGNICRLFFLDAINCDVWYSEYECTMARAERDLYFYGIKR